MQQPLRATNEDLQWASCWAALSVSHSLPDGHVVYLAHAEHPHDVNIILFPWQQHPPHCRVAGHRRLQPRVRPGADVRHLRHPAINNPTVWQLCILGAGAAFTWARHARAKERTITADRYMSGHLTFSGSLTASCEGRSARSRVNTTVRSTQRRILCAEHGSHLHLLLIHACVSGSSVYPSVDILPQPWQLRLWVL